jgi:hypothetical protein
MAAMASSASALVSTAMETVVRCSSGSTSPATSSLATASRLRKSITRSRATRPRFTWPSTARK